MNLYRKYRSQKFSDLVGQEHVVQVLVNALRDGNVGHAYLFSGPRGTGKTSVARLLAKSLNCQNRIPKKFTPLRNEVSSAGLTEANKLKSYPHEPCDECLSCKEILSGSSMDVIEIDAASNRGIDDIRELRDKIKFAPSGKKFKVFIIDEVHMLTREAFNALLKTLEEPPEHAIFVLATTELHKVPDTIISRTQQFDFKRASMANIILRLKHIAKLEKINIDEESLKLIARASEGSFRDAVSLLDQVSGMSKKITAKEARSVLGLSEWQTTIDFLKLISAGKTKEIFDLIDKLYLQGIDFSQFCGDLIDLVRRIMLERIGYADSLDSFTDDQKKELENVTKNWQMSDFMKYIKTFDQANREMKLVSMAQLPLEMASLELTTDKQQPITINQQLSTINYQQTTEKSQISNLKSQNHISNLKTEKNEITSPVIPDRKVVTSTASGRESRIDIPKKFTPLRNEVSSAGLKSHETKKLKVSIDQLKKSWSEIIEKLISKNHSLSILIKDSTPLNLTPNNSLTIGVPFKFYKDRLEGKKIYADVCETIQEHFEIDDLQLKFKIDSSLISSQKSEIINHKSEIKNDLLNDAMEVFGE